MTIYSPEYQANHACQEFEGAKQAALQLWDDRKRVGGRTEQYKIDQEVRTHIDNIIHMITAIRDAALEAQGYRVDEHFGQHDFEVHLVPLE